MYCKSCYYPLENLVEHRCPECGAEFDPKDSGTFFPKTWKQPTPWRDRLVGLAVAAVLLIGLAVITLVRDPDLESTLILAWLVGSLILVFKIKPRPRH